MTTTASSPPSVPPTIGALPVPTGSEEGAHPASTRNRNPRAVFMQPPSVASEGGGKLAKREDAVQRPYERRATAREVPRSETVSQLTNDAVGRRGATRSRPLPSAPLGTWRAHSSAYASSRRGRP